MFGYHAYHLHIMHHALSSLGPSKHISCIQYFDTYATQMAPSGADVSFSPYSPLHYSYVPPHRPHFSCNACASCGTEPQSHDLLCSTTEHRTARPRAHLELISTNLYQVAVLSIISGPNRAPFHCNGCRITHSAVSHVLKTCLAWLKQFGTQILQTRPKEHSGLDNSTAVQREDPN